MIGSPKPILSSSSQGVTYVRETPVVDQGPGGEPNAGETAGLGFLQSPYLWISVAAGLVGIYFLVRR